MQETNAKGRYDDFFIVMDRLHDTLDKKIMRWYQEAFYETPGREKKEEENIIKTRYARQLASALDYLHQRGIIYRDLKPHNVGFTIDGRLQLIDLGMCRDLPKGRDVEDTFEMSCCGTQRYIAPEVVRAGSSYNAKADVYSWAMVVYQMFSLSKPYAEYDSAEHTEYVCYGGERPPRGDLATAPRPIWKIICQAWCQAVESRLSMAEVVVLIDRYLQKETHSVHKFIIPGIRRLVPKSFAARAS